MKTINMGLNTAPYFIEADEAIERHKQYGNKVMVKQWQNMKYETIKLRDEITKTVENEGACSLNWSCTGEGLFNILACQWAKAMPEYQFEIGRYYCIVFKTK